MASGTRSSARGSEAPEPRGNNDQQVTPLSTGASTATNATTPTDDQMAALRRRLEAADLEKQIADLEKQAAQAEADRRALNLMNTSCPAPKAQGSAGPGAPQTDPAETTDDPLSIEPPEDFFTRVKHLHDDRLRARVLWAGLKPSTRETYNTAARSFETFCSYHKIAPWPASFDSLCAWIVGRAFGRNPGFIKKQGKIQPATISAYLSALRSVHIDLKLPTTDFDDDHMKRFMAGIYSLFPPPGPRKAPRPPITKAMLVRILDPSAMTGEDDLDS
ncbi:hypothetical protein E4U19_007861, partial [Claviceps sp. Clav32 group G5]